MIRKFYYIVLSVIVALATISGIFRLDAYYYYGSVVVFLVLAFISKSFNRPKLSSLPIFFFLLVCALSIVINEPPEIFRSWERFGIFCIVIIAFSNLFENVDIANSRVTFLYNLLYICTIFSVLSFFAYFLGINYFVRYDEVLDYNVAGYFSGFTNHSMILAPVASLSTLLSFSNLFSDEIRTKKLKLIFWIFVLLTSLGSLLLSASRGSLLATLVALLFCLFRVSNGNKSKFLRYIMIALFVLLVSFPIWGNLGEFVIEKNNTNLEHGGIFYSREVKMNARLSEIEDNFFTGVGFAAVDATLDYVDRTTGTVEPGSSWLGVFSMTGVWGFILLIIIMSSSLRNAFRIKNFRVSVLSSGLLSFFIVHMIIEGYILAGGSILCAFCWLSVGVANSKFIDR